MSYARRGGFLLLLLLLVLVTIASTTSKYWVHWLSVTIMFSSLLLVDLLFINDGAFVFDPFMNLQKM
eukprot:CAMPEP_0176223320 /NCGR_PEP_ID=MMETSP0121_2-20121125/20683_1 /TAXON_ID=160619 /ORGANISM="Kryptoperidinium foliaceum, Strain CCMP 1326" /LENGTH=66 /DNA_ID=CAMNT_0017562549 /DNA_START=92 /DNA_END=292 /DNA_ORIENTATION=+